MAPNPALVLGLASGPLHVHIDTPDPLVAAALGHAVGLRRDVEIVEREAADLAAFPAPLGTAAAAA